MSCTLRSDFWKYPIGRVLFATGWARVTPKLKRKKAFVSLTKKGMVAVEHERSPKPLIGVAQGAFRQRGRAASEVSLCALRAEGASFGY